MDLKSRVGALRRHEVERRFLDTVFPPRCVGCGARRCWLCPNCLGRVEMLPLPVCSVCGEVLDPAAPHGCRAASAPIVSISAIGAYAGPLRAAVHALKYEGRHAVAAPLAALLAPRLAPLVAAGDLLVPVPLHPARERERGYNQAALLARELARLLPVEPAPDTLRRVRPTADQVTLTGGQRVANVRGAFTAHADRVRYRRVWLVDDVHTTGATLRSAAHSLRAAGASSVYGAVVAMTVHGKQ